MTAVLLWGTVEAALNRKMEEKVPVIENPEFIPASEALFLQEDELVLGLAVGDQAKAYPVRVLGLYEVINDRLGERPVSATW